MKFDRDADSKDGSTSSSAKGTQSPSEKKRRASAPRKTATAKKVAIVESKSEPVASDWIELFPAGISVATAMGRPVLVLKDPNTGDVLPVWMQPLDAGIAMAELSHTMGATPHAVTRQLLAHIKFKVRSCTFVELIGHHQYVMIAIETGVVSERSEKEIETLHLRVRADEAMSFCLQANAKFFSTRDFMIRCRDLDVDLAKLESSLVEGTLPALQAEIENSSKKHPYVM